MGVDSQTAAGQRGCPQPLLALGWLFLSRTAAETDAAHEPYTGPAVTAGVAQALGAKETPANPPGAGTDCDGKSWWW